MITIANRYVRVKSGRPFCPLLASRLKPTLIV